MAQPWWKMYASDYLSDSKVHVLSYEKRGILNECWNIAWKDGGIPADPGKLGMLLGIPAKAMRTHMQWITTFFVPSLDLEGMLISPRMEIERLASEEKGAKARESALQRWSARNANASPDAMRSHMPPQCVDPCDHPCETDAVRSQKSEKDITPTPSGPGLPPSASPPVAPSRKRRGRVEILEAFSPEVRRVVNELAGCWRKEDPEDGRIIRVSVPEFGKAVAVILKTHPETNGDALIKAGKDYCESERKRYKAPQFFFGPEGPWDGYVQTNLTRLVPA